MHNTVCIVGTKLESHFCCLIASFSSIVDPDSLNPDSLNPDSDPAFQVNPDPYRIRIQGFDDQKLETNIADFFIFLDHKLPFTYP
jgi:hypothetical protein